MGTYTVPDASTFEADYKGTCALCWGTVHPGHKVVKVEVEVMHEKFPRNVHVHCQENFVNSSPADMREELIAAVVS